MARPITNTYESVNHKWWSDRTVINENGCWIWTKTKWGKPLVYGHPYLDGKRWLAHRLSWHFHIGPIPVGMQVCHKCDVPLCVNPSHLFLGTISDNIKDCKSKGRNAFGERQHLSKLTVNAVKQIRSEHVPGDKDLGVNGLARRYGVAHGIISSVIRRKTWKQVT